MMVCPIYTTMEREKGFVTFEVDREDKENPSIVYDDNNTYSLYKYCPTRDYYSLETRCDDLNIERINDPIVVPIEQPRIYHSFK